MTEVGGGEGEHIRTPGGRAVVRLTRQYDGTVGALGHQRLVTVDVARRGYDM
jgi:hypothetical protein